MLESQTRKLAATALAAALLLPAGLMAGCQSQQPAASNATANTASNAAEEEEDDSLANYQAPEPVNAPVSEQVRNLASQPQVISYAGAQLVLDDDTLASLLAKLPDLAVDEEWSAEDGGSVSARSTCDVQLRSGQFPDLSLTAFAYNDTDQPTPLMECKIGGLDVSCPDEQEVPDVVLPGGFTMAMTGEDAKSLYGEPTVSYDFNAWMLADEKARSSYGEDLEFLYGDQENGSTPLLMFTFPDGLSKPCEDASYSTVAYNSVWNDESSRGAEEGAAIGVNAYLGGDEGEPADEGSGTTGTRG